MKRPEWLTDDVLSSALARAFPRDPRTNVDQMVALVGEVIKVCEDMDFNKMPQKARPDFLAGYDAGMKDKQLSLSNPLWCHGCTPDNCVGCRVPTAAPAAPAAPAPSEPAGVPVHMCNDAGGLAFGQHRDCATCSPAPAAQELTDAEILTKANHNGMWGLRVEGTWESTSDGRRVIKTVRDCIAASRTTPE